jgi:hypothetical protein
VKESIISALKTKYSNLGFSEKTFTGVADYLAATVTEETQIETAITGVEPLLKLVQGEVDTRVSTALKRKEAEPKNNQKQQESQPANTQAPSYEDKIQVLLNTLVSKVENLEKKETHAQMMARLKAKITDKVPESFLRGRQITIETESDIDIVAQSIEADYTAFKQDLINQGVIIDSPKQGQQNAKAGVDFALAEAKRRNEGGSANNPVPGIKL